MNVSVLGLGMIGSAWARNLIADGHVVRIWNRTSKVFPNFQASIEDAVAEAETIFVVVADPPALTKFFRGSDLKEPKLRQHDYSPYYSPQFSLKHMAKDLRLALETAEELRLALDLTEHLKKTYDRGMDAGWKEDSSRKAVSSA